jgi:DNA-binding NarL/FixJ family response regulator
VWVVSDDAALSAAVGAALTATGWPSVRVVAGERLPQVARAVLHQGKLVLVADAEGRLPDPRPALLGRAPPVVVAVGTRTALPALADAVARLVATEAVDADQPFTDLIDALDRILRQGVRRADPAGLLDTLRTRELEARRFERLTEREMEMLAALVVGDAAAEIAHARQISLATVRSHIRAVLSKVGVRSQLAAVALTHRSCREPPVVERMRRAHHNWG